MRQQRLAVERQAVGRFGMTERGAPAGHVERARDQPAAFHGCKQFGNAAVHRQRLGHEFDRAAAGQAEAMRFLGADAVFHRFRARGPDAFAMHAIDDVVLDAAARYRADHEAVVTHRQHGAFRTWRRAPRSDYRYQQYAMSFMLPLDAALQDFEIHAVHDRFRFFS
jgi:hypothetical protein